MLLEMEIKCNLLYPRKFLYRIPTLNFFYIFIVCDI